MEKRTPRASSSTGKTRASKSATPARPSKGRAATPAKATAAKPASKATKSAGKVVKPAAKTGKSATAKTAKTVTAKTAKTATKSTTARTPKAATTKAATTTKAAKPAAAKTAARPAKSAGKAPARKKKGGRDLGSWLTKDRKFLASSLRKAKLKSLEATITEVARPTVMASLRWTDPLPVGSSRVGGLPDVAAGFVWPRTAAGAPMLFFAQVSCADVAPLDAEEILPTAGLLSFFVRGGSDYEGAVIFTPEGEALSEAALPAGLTKKDVLPTMEITNVRAGHTLPARSDGATERLLGTSDSKLLASYEQMQTRFTNAHGAFMTMGGYPQLPHRIESSEQDHALLRMSVPWEEHHFGDGDLFACWITRKDLLARRFDRVRFRSPRS